VPRLRWSRPKSTPRRGLVSGTRRVRNSKPLPPRDRIERLGKIRGAVVDALEVASGKLTLQELCEILHRKRARDLRRRVLPMLEEAGIIGVEGDTVVLTGDWVMRLEDARRIGGEQETDELAEKRRKLNSRAYHSRHETPRSRPSVVGLAAVRVSRDRRRAYRGAHVGDTAANTPSDAELVARRRRVERLVRAGMARRFAEQEVNGSAVSCARRSDPPSGPPDEAGARKMPRMVEGIYVHGAVCECEWCAA
jgi:hypothetical protein